MNDEMILDHSRQRIVNRIFVLFVALYIVGILLFVYNDIMSIETLFLGLFGGPILLFVLSAVFGALSKRGIDYLEGEWTKRKEWVSISEYEQLEKKYKDAYGQLFGSGTNMICCGSFCIVLIVVFSVLLFLAFSDPFISAEVDVIIVLPLLHLLSAAIGFLIGFSRVHIDAEAFFKPPLDKNTLRYALELEKVPMIRTGLNVEIGERSGSLTILDAEIKSYVEGLPDTVAISLQVSYSGFAYPYLVGTVYKGRIAESQEIIRSIGTRYPALIEMSQDDDVAVLVARFEIPERTSSVPRISDKDFRQLAALLAEKLRETYQSS